MSENASEEKDLLEFKSLFTIWLNNIYIEIKKEKQKISSDTDEEEFDPKEYFLKEFDNFLKKNLIIGIENRESEPIELLNYFSSIFDIIIEMSIEKSPESIPFLKLDEYYEVLESKMKYIGINTREFYISQTKINDIYDAICKNKIHINWINIEFWTDYYKKLPLKEKELKSCLRNLILLIIMFKKRKDRYERMDIKIIDY